MNRSILNSFDSQRRRRFYLFPIFAALLFAHGWFPANAQTVQPSPAAPAKTVSKNSLERNFFKNLLQDQKAIWTSPFHLDKSDARWLAPLGIATAGLLATDRRTAGTLSNNRARINASLDISRLGSAYTAGGAALGFYAVGKIAGNKRATETGLLAGEALINSGIVVSALKFVTQRPRPLEKNGHGNFFTGGNSFPSGHSATAWTLAAIISDEYGACHPFVKYAAYGAATAVGISRYTARRHFLSDVLVGSAIGYGIGHLTFKLHHDAALDSPNDGRSQTKLEKYFPSITPQYDPRGKISGASLAWNF